MSRQTDTAAANAANKAARTGLTAAQITGAAPLAPGSGAEPPPLAIPIKQTFAALAAAVATALKAHPGRLFIKDGAYGTVLVDRAKQRYQFLPMEPERLTTWLEEQGIAHFFALGKPPKATDKNPFPEPTKLPTSLSPAQAKIILSSDIVREAVPEIKEIMPLRLPICYRMANGNYRFAPAKQGYDPETKIYSLDFMPIDWSPTAAWPLQRCVRALIHVFKDFPLDGGTVPIMQSRSMGTIVTAMLGQFLHHGLTLFPMIAVNANQPGTGKSFCVQAMLAPFYGEISAGNYLEDDNEMRKTLNSAILEGQSVFFLDDIATLSGRVLPRYITLKSVKDRILGTNKNFEKENRMQFFVTGNGLKTNKDIERRVLPIDLFTAEDAPTRTAKLQDLKEEHFTNTAWRADMLRALWGLCLHWQNAGCPRRATPMASFKTYIDLCANIAMAAGFADPLSPRPINLDTGDTMGAALLELVILVADSILPADPTGPHTGLTETKKVSDLVDIARDADLLDIITNAAREPAAILGRQMRKLNGRRLKDSHGREFEIGNATRAVRTAYPFVIRSEPTRTLEEDTALNNLSEEDAAALAEFSYTPTQI